MNMPTISQLLQYILSKRYGEEVRGAIHDAIEKCYQDVNSATLREDAFRAALQAAIDHGDIPGMVIADNSVPGTKIQDGTLPLSKLAEPVQITVDSALSDSSPNPVQNKVIKGAIDELNGSLEELQNDVLTDDIKNALLGVLENVVTNNTDAATHFSVLRELFGDPVTVTFDGTKYLRTGVVLTANSKIEIKAKFNSDDNGQYMGTILKDGNVYKRAHFGVVLANNIKVICINNAITNVTFNRLPYDNAPHIYTMYDGHCGIDGNIHEETASMNDGFPIGTEFYLFYRNKNSDSYTQIPCKAGIYYMKVYESDVLTHDFEPVVVDGTVKLYDTIGQTYCEEVIT